MGSVGVIYPNTQVLPNYFDRKLVSKQWDWFWSGKSTVVVPALAPKTLGFYSVALTPLGAQASEIVLAARGPMGLGLDRDVAGGVASVKIGEGGDAFATTFGFRGDAPWTVCTVFQVYDTAGDDRAIVSRFGDFNGNAKYFLLRTDKQAAPSNLEVYQGDADNVSRLRITGGDVIELDTPYLAVVTHNGSASLPGTLYTFDLNTGKIVDDALTNQNFASVQSTASSEYVSMLGRTGSDHLRGTGWMTSFHDFEFTRAQVDQLAANVFGPFRPDLRIIGKAPAAGGDTNIAVGVDALVLAEQTAVVAHDIDVLAVVDALVLAEQAATVSLGVDIAATTDVLTIATFAATIVLDVDVLATTDVLVLAEFAASAQLNKFVAATADVLILAEQQAVVNAETNVDAGVDALVLAEAAATVVYDVDVLAGTDALVLTEQTATVSLAIDIAAGVDALVIAEFAATVNAETNVDTVVDALVLVGLQATIQVGDDVNVAAGVDALVLDEKQATVNAETNINAGVDALALTEFAALVALDIDIQANTDTLLIAEQAATIVYDVDVLAAVDALILAEHRSVITAFGAGGAVTYASSRSRTLTLKRGP